MEEERLREEGSPRLNSSEMLRQQVCDLQFGADVSDSDALPAETFNQPVNANSVTPKHMSDCAGTSFLQYFITASLSSATINGVTKVVRAFPLASWPSPRMGRVESTISSRVSALAGVPSGVWRSSLEPCGRLGPPEPFLGLCDRLGSRGQSGPARVPTTMSQNPRTGRPSTRRAVSRATISLSVDEWLTTVCFFDKALIGMNVFGPTRHT